MAQHRDSVIKAKKKADDFNPTLANGLPLALPLLQQAQPWWLAEGKNLRAERKYLSETNAPHSAPMC